MYVEKIKLKWSQKTTRGEKVAMLMYNSFFNSMINKVRKNKNRFDKFRAFRLSPEIHGISKLPFCVPYK